MSEMQESILESAPQIPIGFCQCGCGRQTEISKWTKQHKRHLTIKGQPCRYIHGHHPTGKKRPRHIVEAIRKALSGPNNYNYKGGVYRAKYRDVYMWRVTTRNKSSVDYSHVIMEGILGHEVPKGMIVHHINGNHEDNRPENLQLMKQSDHIKIHVDSSKNGHRYRGWAPHHYKRPNAICHPDRPHEAKGLCKRCYNWWRSKWKQSRLPKV